MAWRCGQWLGQGPSTDLPENGRGNGMRLRKTAMAEEEGEGWERAESEKVAAFRESRGRGVKDAWVRRGKRRCRCRGAPWRGRRGMRDEQTELSER